MALRWIGFLGVVMRAGGATGEAIAIFCSLSTFNRERAKSA